MVSHGSDCRGGRPAVIRVSSIGTTTRRIETVTAFGLATPRGFRPPPMVTDEP